MFEDVEVVVDDRGDIATVVPIEEAWCIIETVSADDALSPRE